MSCRKVYQASEANKLFLMRFASIHGEDSYLYWGRGGGGGVVGSCGGWICVRRCERCKRVTVPPNHPGGVANL